ncbi:putative sugar O-methyltransferase [Mycobacterium alsense]|uniref:putative sugar O-methyltransferase n=1 Tax=Mycobacterium alsense TaxID=324058 RepID=UPI0009EE8C6B|nr:putative sugar O-methyltransferase [Mycobacterium alsense]
MTETELHRACNSMLQEIEKDRRFLASKFWNDVGQKNMAMLEGRGLDNFKRTVSQNYFNWVVGKRAPMVRHVYLNWLKRPTLNPWRSSIEDDVTLSFTTHDSPVRLTAKQKNDYRRFVTYVWDLMVRIDKRDLHLHLSEPTLGNPIKIRLGETLISQDLANSIIEANVIADLLDSPSSQRRVAEIGAGSGRLAHVFAETLQGQYVIFDIPPALYVSQWYLSQLFPNKKIFRFRPFDDFSTIEAELSRADIAFFTSNQITKFPDGYFNVMLSISTLPEMSREQVALYIDLFQRKSSDYIYLKQWKSWKNPLDGTDIGPDDYINGSEWKLSRDFSDPIVPEFFDRVWRRETK